MNSFLAVTDTGNYAGISSEYISEAIIAYAHSIENREADAPWLTPGEEFGELRESLRLELDI